MKQTKKIESPKQPLLTASQRAMAAAKRIENLAPLARQRQRAGVKAPDGTKGKASKQAATEEGVGTRSVELARLVRRRCMPEVVAAVESGLITVSTAAKLAKAYPGTQQRIVKKVEKGRPVLEVLAEIGFQDRRPPKFDDGVFKKLLDRFQRLLDLRSGHPCYPTARQRLKELQDNMRWWKRSASRKPRQFFDGYGRQLLERTSAAFALFEEHRDTCYEIDSLISRIEKLSRKEGGQCIPAKDLRDKLKEVRDIFADAIPKKVCHCGGYSDSCSSCGGRGWEPVRGFLACDPNEHIYSRPTA